MLVAYRLLAALALLCCCSAAAASTVYRYQDAAGRWHFSDRKPKQAHQTLEMVEAEAKNLEPQLRFAQQGEQKQLVALNPLHAPVQFQLLLNDTQLASWVVEARSQTPVEIDGQQMVEWHSGYEYRYRLGRPVTDGDRLPLLPPVPSTGKFLITQAFGGEHSHSEEPNRHAIDVAMPVGETIHAARDGVVVVVKDDYHMGGVNQYFLDKANRIEILHSDGTFAVYGHILMGSALVKEGQRVRAGAPVAGAGSSGYSSGPHLHFGLRANNGEHTVSLPFKFKQGDRVFEPRKAQWLQSQ